MTTSKNDNGFFNAAPTKKQTTIPAVRSNKAASPSEQRNASRTTKPVKPKK